MANFVVHQGRPVDLESGRIYGREIATHVDPSGYRQVYLPGGSKTVQAHRFVWEAAHGPIPPGMQINHMNGNKADNRLSNLELVTHHENILHAWATGLARGMAGEEHPAAKLNNIRVLAIRALAEFGISRSELAKKSGVSVRQVSAIIHRRSWSHLPDLPTRIEDL